jgi:hypothetical protein
MKASIFYRIASVLLLLFAIGHTFGFRQNNPAWGVDAILSAMRSVQFDAQGFTRTYWDFFSAFGLFFSVFLMFSAVLAWQLGSVRAEDFGVFMRRIAWALAISFAVITAFELQIRLHHPNRFLSDDYGVFHRRSLALSEANPTFHLMRPQYFQGVHQCGENGH